MNALRLRNFTGYQLLARLAIMVAGAMFFTTRADAQPTVLNDGGLTTINAVTNDYRNQPNNWWIVIGTNFPNTRVIVSNAGWLVDDGAIVGAGVNSSFNNVTITGAGSQWRSFRIDLGVQGSANTVTNINGGQTRVNSDIKLGTEVTSHSNVFEVIGNGSSLHQGADLYAVGYRGSYNRMIIRQGGAATNNASGAIGYHSTSSNNTVEVTGAGSTWSVTRHLDIGYAGDNNALVISNGAYMDSSWQSSANFQGASIGALAGSDNNRALVTGPGSRWSFSTQEGTLLEVGNRGSGNTLTVSNGGLINMGYSVAKLNVIAGFNDSSIQNQILVTGAGSAISNNGYLAVGYHGDNNTMEIRGGGRISNLDGYIGLLSSTGNQVVVEGAGSVWSNRYELIVGYDGADTGWSLPMAAS